MPYFYLFIGMLCSYIKKERIGSHSHPQTPLRKHHNPENAIPKHHSSSQSPRLILRFRKEVISSSCYLCDSIRPYSPLLNPVHRNVTNYHSLLPLNFHARIPFPFPLSVCVWGSEILPARRSLFAHLLGLPFDTFLARRSSTLASTGN